MTDIKHETRDGMYYATRRIEDIERQLRDMNTMLSTCSAKGSVATGDIVELKERVELLRSTVNELKLDVQNNTMIVLVVKWLGAAVAGSAIALLVSAFLVNGV